MRELERRVVLSVLDRKWREHLYEMDYLQEGIGLRAMGQRDPVVEYQREGFDMFASDDGRHQGGVRRLPVQPDHPGRGAGPRSTPCPEPTRRRTPACRRRSRPDTPDPRTSQTRTTSGAAPLPVDPRVAGAPTSAIPVPPRGPAAPAQPAAAAQPPAAAQSAARGGRGRPGRGPAPESQRPGGGQRNGQRDGRRSGRTPPRRRPARPHGLRSGAVPAGAGVGARRLPRCGARRPSPAAAELHRARRGRPGSPARGGGRRRQRRPREPAAGPSRRHPVAQRAVPLRLGPQVQAVSRGAAPDPGLEAPRASCTDRRRWLRSCDDTM